jgi:alkyl hydroperoxide reductase subunit AhpC
MFIISHDTPAHQLELHNALKDLYGFSLNLVSDPELKLIDHLNMKNGDTAYRGYALMDQEGKVIFHTVNDQWGKEITKTADEIKVEYSKLDNK